VSRTIPDLNYTSFISIGTATENWSGIVFRHKTGQSSTSALTGGVGGGNWKNGVSLSRVNAELAEYLHNLKPAHVLLQAPNHLRYI